MSGFSFTIPALKFDDTTYPVSPITVIPDKGLSKTVTPRVHKAQFGDGYSQRVQDGINPLGEVFTVSFNTRPRAEIDDIIAFFDVLGAVEPFELTLSDYREGIGGPNTKVVKVICTNYTQTYLYDNFYSATATFERVYTPIAGA